MSFEIGMNGYQTDNKPDSNKNYSFLYMVLFFHENLKAIRNELIQIN